MQRRRILLGSLVALAACTHGAAVQRSGDPRVAFQPPGEPPVEVRVELARTPDEQRLGLMHRDRLEPGHGMLFLNRRPSHLVFWMHETKIPLDMIFLGADRAVVGVVENAEPFTDDARSVDGESQYVVEVPAGWAAHYRIRPGTPARFLDVD
jgi:uncharacterized membrane protein (UPF0127 family)